MSASPIPEFAQEMQVTRRLLARVPDDRADWRPHPKSFTLAHLAMLVAGMPAWTVDMARAPSIDITTSRPYANYPVATLLEWFDAGVDDAEAALAGLAPAQLDETWVLKAGDHVLATTTRGEALRSHLHHVVHHRAQLGVYLRLLDIPVPCMYGPTADESWGG